jgi:putative membrane protein
VFEGKSRGGLPATADAEATPPSLPSPVAAPNEVTLLHLPLRELLLCGFLENRGLVIVGAIYGFFWEFGPIGGFWNRVVDEGSYGSGFVRDTVRSVLAGGSPPLGKLAVIAAGVIGFLLVVRVISMAWAVVRLYGFRLTRAGEDLRTEYGLFTRVSATIPLGRIQTMTIREGPLHRRLGRVAVRVETAGGAPAKGGSSVDREWLAPLVRVEELPSLVREVIPELDVAGIEWRPVHPRAFRRAVKPSMAIALAVPAALSAAMGWWALAVLPLSVAWFALGARKHVDHLAWSDTGDAAVFKSGWLWRVQTIARVAKIQAVTIKESPFDRRTAMARVRVDTAGANERSVRVDIPYLPREMAVDLHHRLAAGAARTDFRW